MLPTISQVDYEIRLVQHLIEIRFLRLFDGKLITSRSIVGETLGFETEDSLCREWLLSIYSSYHFYEGFDTIESCIDYIQTSPYDKNKFRIVQFCDMYYAVINENTQFQQVIGKDLSYFSRNLVFLTAKKPPLNLVLKDRVKIPVIPLIYHELHAFDSNIKVYQLPHEKADNAVQIPVQEALEYVVLLGVTFKDIWYSCNTPHAIAHNRALLNLYFDPGHNLTAFGKYSNALAINPFQRLIYLPKGRIEHFQMDVDDLRTPARTLTYRDVRRFHDQMRIRKVNFEEGMNA
ncbi:MAG: hypothetical protein RR642_03575 [Solibacillus sp.]